MSSNGKWTCNGIPKNPKYKGPAKPHPPFTNQANYTHCAECQLPREAVISSGGGTVKIGLIAGGVAVLACIIHEEKTKQKNKQLASKLIWKEMARKKIANMTNKTLKNELKKLKLCCVDIVIL